MRANFIAAFRTVSITHRDGYKAYNIRLQCIIDGHTLSVPLITIDHSVFLSINSQL